MSATQHALARDYGFESWAKIKDHLEVSSAERPLLRPAELKSDEKLLWSLGHGTDPWALIQACAAGDLEAARALLARDASLARAMKWSNFC